ncbi:FRG domain-containing protein [Haloferax sp. DFSO52]|uniref:FRG domain-containing protein n=1 Tax=Haloferax sp. DFSO52 TaxID=3388505 RepID=UPI003A836794
MGNSTSNEVVAEDWSALQEVLGQHTWNEQLGRYRSPFVFRGMSNADYVLESSITRYVSETGRWELEGHLLRNFLKYAQQDIDVPDSPYYRLAIAQHHGLPTRLIDWTYSPAVAAYFATGGRSDADGVIWAVDYVRTHEQLPGFLRESLERLNTEMFDADLLDDVTHLLLDRYTDGGGKSRRAGVLEMFDMLEAIEAFVAEQADDYVLFFEPPAIDQRIVNQAALFSSQSNPTVGMDTWLENRPDLYRRIIVPADRKAEFRDRLDQLNVNRRTLFPGLDGIANWLTEYYAPKPA